MSDNLIQWSPQGGRLVDQHRGEDVVDARPCLGGGLVYDSDDAREGASISEYGGCHRRSVRGARASPDIQPLGQQGQAVVGDCYGEADVVGAGWAVELAGADEDARFGGEAFGEAPGVAAGGLDP